MEQDSSRSEQVIEQYKKHKLSISALWRIHELIQGFEQDRKVDLRMAQIGIVIIFLLLGAAVWLFFSGDNITLF